MNKTNKNPNYELFKKSKQLLNEILKQENLDKIVKELKASSNKVKNIKKFTWRDYADVESALFDLMLDNYEIDLSLVDEKTANLYVKRVAETLGFPTSMTVIPKIESFVSYLISDFYDITDKSVLNNSNYDPLTYDKLEDYLDVIINIDFLENVAFNLIELSEEELDVISKNIKQIKIDLIKTHTDEFNELRSEPISKGIILSSPIVENVVCVVLEKILKDKNFGKIKNLKNIFSQDVTDLSYFQNLNVTDIITHNIKKGSELDTDDIVESIYDEVESRIMVIIGHITLKA